MRTDVAKLPYTHDALMERLDAGEPFEFLLFYGHQPSKDGSASKSCFSQWFPGPFEVDGVHYETAEQYMMAGKARLFNDEATLAEIMASPDPAAAKRLGQKVSNFVDEVWRRESFEIVVKGNLAKFSQNADFGQFLKSTAPKILVEASPSDRIWGIGLGPTNQEGLDPYKWRGNNLLGFALTRVRDELLNAG